MAYKSRIKVDQSSSTSNIDCNSRIPFAALCPSVQSVLVQCAVLVVILDIASLCCMSNTTCLGKCCGVLIHWSNSTDKDHIPSHFEKLSKEHLMESISISSYCSSTCPIPVESCDGAALSRDSSSTRVMLDDC